jgi:glycerophosphoryl diester phosphodiesterase
MFDARRFLVATLIGLAAVAGPTPEALAEAGNGEAHRPIVIGHRGASGYLPEHTLEAYALAIELGADYIEPDLVMTKDGYLIVRHEPNLIATTDVKDRPEFAGYKRKAVVDGAEEEGFFASDFTLHEIKTLRTIQAFAERPQQFNGKFEIPTFEEVIELAKRKSHEKERPIGVYPETKHPTYHQQLALPLEPRLVEALKHAGWNRRDAPIFIQSFEQSNLQALRKMTPVRLVQLVDANDVNPDGSLDFTAPFDRPYDWTVSNDAQLKARTFGFFVTDAGLKEISTYADGIGPWKRYIVSTVAADLNGDGTIGDENGDGRIDEADRKLLSPSDLIRRAHAHGLLIHTWTFRNEQRRLASDYSGNPLNEYLQFYELGIDGVFADFPDSAFAARVLFEIAKNADTARCLVGDRSRDRPKCANGRD